MENNAEKVQKERKERFFEVVEKKLLTGYQLEQEGVIKQSAFSRYKSGDTKELRLKTIAKFCDFTGANIDYILYGKEPMLKVVSKKETETICKECNVKDGVIKHLMGIIDEHERKLDEYRKECARLREELQGYRKAQ